MPAETPQHYIRYLTYLRKSTDERNRQVLSLITQKRMASDIASSNRLRSLRTYQESRSAKEPGRPIFNTVLDRIQRGEAEGLICCNIDRLYRNPVDEGRVRWMLQQGVIKSIFTPGREYRPPDAGLLMAVEGGRANDDIIRMKARIAEGIEDKLRGGAWPGPRPYGFSYNHRIGNIVPVPAQARVLVQIYEEVADRRLSLNAARARLAELGLRSKNSTPISKDHVRRLLSNKLYVGIMVWKDKSYEGRYKTIISPELFTRVAAVLNDRAKPRKSRHVHDFPFRGLFKCSCGSMVTAQFAHGHGGLYRYYRCTRKTGACSEPYIQEQHLATQCRAFVSRFGISTENALTLRTLVDELASSEDSQVEAGVDALNTQIATTQKQLDRLAQGYAADLIDDDSYRRMSAEFVMSKRRLKAERERIQVQGGASWVEPTKDAILALEMAGKAPSDVSFTELALLVRKLGTNHAVRGKAMSADVRRPFDFVATLLAETGVSSDHQSANQSSPARGRIHWCRMLDHLRTYYQENAR